MVNPDWYHEWRHEAYHQLQEKNAKLKVEYRLGDWPQYNYDLNAGTLLFSKHGVPKVIARIQVAGTTSRKAGEWLWAWANPHVPAELIKAAVITRAFGQECGIGELTCESVRDDDQRALGWELTSIAVRIVDAVGAYRPPRQEGGGLYLIYKDITWAS